MLLPLKSLQAAWRFRDYKPKPLTIFSAHNWMKQFDKSERLLIAKLLDNVIYLSEKDTSDMLVRLNENFLEYTKSLGIPEKKLIYVSVHDAASSSPVMLNILRDRGNLEKRGCRIIDGRDRLGLLNAMNKLEKGVLVYVDDFVGSGTQFCNERDSIYSSVVQTFSVDTFSEFIIAPSICEEAFEKLEARAVLPFVGHKHTKSERPLHPESEIFEAQDRDTAVKLCMKINKFGLGFAGLATMVVFYRNAPNTVPIVFRGNMNQTPHFGIFPRYDDLPVMSR